LNRHLTTSITAAAFCLLALLGACDQDENETCQVDSDCASGLVCCPGGSGDRGYCSDEVACEGVAEVDSGSSMPLPDDDAGGGDGGGDGDGDGDAGGGNDGG
jgi:hypothetical protein